MAPGSDPTLWQRPVSLGRFGKFGGKYVPETPMHALSELETAFRSLATDGNFQTLFFMIGIDRKHFANWVVEVCGLCLLDLVLRDWDRKQTFCDVERVSRDLEGLRGLFSPSVWSSSVHYLHGCSRMERQALNVFRMRLLGAEVRGVHSGTATLKDATSEAIRDWVTNFETIHYILGSVAGPHPYPMMGDDGQIIEPHSISAGLDYPGVGPEHSFLEDMGRLERIIPALETSHALAHLEKLCPTLPDGTRVVLNFRGRGDKDVQTVAKYLEVFEV
ncbi:hypothetical protein DY000_02017127 [Brassica cretica]|uniref:Tryptophan synthase n=1 Tax=Brassica cretica TaxID=69181 RepID=A0ABQ7CRC9_BRACR|nr:hypothetical protein DY000_02017127 [Brassica cretica]